MEREKKKENAFRFSIIFTNGHIKMTFFDKLIIFPYNKSYLTYFLEHKLSLIWYHDKEKLILTRIENQKVCLNFLISDLFHVLKT